MKRNKFPPGPNFLEYSWTYYKEGFNFLNLARSLVKKYGDLVHVKIGHRHHFYINHPEHIQEILMGGYNIRTSRPRPLRHSLGRGLITSQGEFHKTMRRIIQPYFRRQSIEEKSDMIIEQVEYLLAKWQNNETRDIAEDMTYLALAIITHILFGRAFDDEAMTRKIGEVAHTVHLYGNQSPASHFFTRLDEWVPWLGKYSPPAKGRKFLDDIIYGQIEKRRAEKDFDGPDVLSALLKLQTTEEGKKYLTDQQIRDELMTLFLAGHETTASTLAWTLYLISQNPEVEEKLHEEVDRVLGGRVPTMEDVPKLTYLKMIWLESMRLYPAVWTLGRRPEGDDVYVDGYHIPNKSMILISPYLTHHDERFFPDPERFDPERFAPEEMKKRHRFAYYPFGGGNRKCMGEILADIEGVLSLSMIASHWRMKLVPNHPIEMEPLISLKPKYGVRMTLEKRTPKPATVAS